MKKGAKYRIDKFARVFRREELATEDPITQPSNMARRTQFGLMENTETRRGTRI
jgi:hypothetical protein